MRALVEKEIRLLLPAFAGALVLAILPIWLFPVDSRNPGAIPGFFFWFGIVMLPLSSFGREIGLKTIPFMLAQPLERGRIWWTKVAVLGVFMALAFDAWWLSGSLRSILRPALRALPEILAFSGAIVAIYAAGVLWMTLLLRQVVAAFWLAILIPMVMVIPIQAMGGTDWMIFTVLGFYAAVAFFLARWQFLHLQDTAWTGGVITFGRGRAVGAESTSRERRSWPALFRKELKLHEFTLAGIAGLFMLHLGVLALRKAGVHVFGEMTRLALQSFGLMWLFVPLLAGSQSVAEERQLGTLDGLLCLPISRRVQFGVKVVFVLVLGGLLSWALMRAAEEIGRSVGAGTGAIAGNYFEFNLLLLVFLALSLLGFYASTLTRGIVQALVAGVVASVVLWNIIAIADRPAAVAAFGRQLWPVMAVPAVIVAIIWLAYGNFKWTFESGRRWRRNVLGLTTVIVLISGSAAAIYHRAWEWAMPLEAAHGPARLPAGKPVLLRSYGGIGLAAVLPDGGLWTDRIAYDAGWLSLGGTQFVTGSNWVDAFANSVETVALRSDGTLWVSEKPRQPWLEDRHPPPEVSPPLVQFGVESDWQCLQCNPFMPSFYLLKQDGTLWSWGTNDVNKKHYDGLRSLAPRRLDGDSDWARILRGDRWTYAWKRDGSAWALHNANRDEDWGNIRLAALDHVQFRSLNSIPCVLNIEVGVRDDGTLWYWDGQQALSGPEKARSMGPLPKLLQIGKDSNWASVASGFYELVALNTDGSIWEWNLFRERRADVGMLQEAPERLGMHNDWVALGDWLNRSVALAADGTLWRLPRAGAPTGWGDEDSESWLAPSRRPAKIENILSAHQ
jgi:ABC-type transport system involved in multi-copper enzyme maturation permease subunit